jgi:hypothetical protein
MTEKTKNENILEIIDELIKKENIKELTKILQKIDESLIQKLYLNYLKEKDFENIKDLFILTGIRPKIDFKILNNVYKELLKNESIKDIEFLFFITNVKPKFDEKEIQEVYKRLLLNREYKKIRKLKFLTLKEPQLEDSFIKKIISYHLKNGKIIELELLLEELSIKQTDLNSFNEKFVKKLVLDYLKKGWLYEVIRLVNFFENYTIKIKKSKIQKIYHLYLERDWIDKIEFLMELSRVKPEFDKKLVLKKLKDYFNNNNFSNLTKLICISKYCPFNFLKIDIPKDKILNYLKEGDVIKFEKLFCLSCFKVKIEEKLLNEVVIRLLEEHKLIEVSILSDIFDIKLDKETIQYFYKKYFEKESYWSILQLLNLTRVPFEIDEEKIKELIKEYEKEDPMYSEEPYDLEILMKINKKLKSCKENETILIWLE